MSTFKTLGKKLRLAKKGRQTKWAPIWIIPRIFGQPRRIHPSRFTNIKRNWRRTKIKV